MLKTDKVALECVADRLVANPGLKPMTGAKIFTDPGGEPLAILCKATGLPKAALRAFWKGLRRPESDEAGQMSPGLERAVIAYDMMAVDKAQTTYPAQLMQALGRD